MLEVLATAAETGGHVGPEVVAKGIFATVLAIVVFIGSVYLLVALVLGPRLGYFLTGSVVFGIMVLLSVIWFGSVLGPKGPVTTWEAIGAGPDLTEVEGHGNTYDIRDYPGGDWKAPGDDVLVEGAASTLVEADGARPVLDTFVQSAVSPIPGVREREAGKLKGEVDLLPGNFAVTEIRMKEATVEGKESIIAVAKAVPADELVAPDFGAEEAEITEVIAQPGDTVKAGDPVLRISVPDKGDAQVPASRDGTIVSLALGVGDLVKPGVPYAEVDISGQPGQPGPVEVAAVRVRGAQRIPALYYLVVSLVLFAVHMKGLQATEKRLKAQAALA